MFTVRGRKMPQSRAERKLRRRVDEAAQLFGAGDVGGEKKSILLANRRQFLP